MIPGATSSQPRQQRAHFHDRRLDATAYRRHDDQPVKLPVGLPQFDAQRGVLRLKQSDPLEASWVGHRVSLPTWQSAWSGENIEEDSREHDPRDHVLKVDGLIRAISADHRS